MKATELRIGNFVLTKDGITIVTDVLEFGININHDCWIYDIQDIKPIPLTEEWLVKMGFVPAKGSSISGIWFSNGFIDYCISGGSTCFKQEPIRRIKYANQLQNLYFALTGEELGFTN